MDPEEQPIRVVLTFEPDLLREWNDSLNRYFAVVGMRIYNPVNPVPIIYIEP